MIDIHKKKKKEKKRFNMKNAAFESDGTNWCREWTSGSAGAVETLAGVRECYRTVLLLA